MDTTYHRLALSTQLPGLPRWVQNGLVFVVRHMGAGQIHLTGLSV